MYIKNKDGWLKHFDFIFIDLLCVEASFILAFIMRHGFSVSNFFRNYVDLCYELLLIHFLIIFFVEIYSGILRRGFLKEFKSVVKYNLILLAVVITIMFALQNSAIYSRMMFLEMFLINIGLMYASRLLTKRILHYKCINEKNLSHMLLVSKQALVHETAKKLLTNEYNRIKIDKILIIDQTKEIYNVDGIPVAKTLEELLEYAKKNIVDEVFIDLYTNKELIKEISEQFDKMGVTTHINLYQIGKQLPNTIVQNISGFTTLTTSVNFITFRQTLIKRVIDILAGIAGFVTTLIAFIIFAPIIYIQSPGPIFFSQERVGMNGRRFRIYKFRSMYMDAEERKKELMSQNKMDGHMFKIDNDPRIIPIGKFMRKFSIDELPQSFNILRGEMSLVGTRPPTVDEYEKYKKHHKKRLAAKPGLTGMWQVSGRSNITDFEDIVRLDTEYLATWTLGLDLKIILKTVGVVLGRSGSV